MHVDEHDLALRASGDLTAERRAAVEEHLAVCEQCCSLECSYSAMVAKLTMPIGAVPAGVADRIMRAAAERRPSPSKADRRPLVALLAAGLVAAIVLPVVMRRDPDALRSKGASDQRQTFVGLDAYRVASGSELAEHVGASIASNDGLVFSYRNRGPRPARYMMVVAVDAKHGIHWFYPAKDDAASDPASLAIAAGDDVKLADLVPCDFPAGPLTVYGLFSQEALHISRIERALADDSLGSIGGVDMSVLHLEVRQ